MVKQARKCVKCDKSSYCSGFCRQHFMNYFEKKVLRTIHQFKLFTKQEKVAVAVSGGKDSTVCLYVLKKLGYNVEALTVNAFIGNYSQENLDNLRKVCKQYSLKLYEISFREEFGMSLCFITSVAKSRGLDYSSCLICGVLRRYLLNKHAKKLGFDCVCTGHNLDDEAQAFVMNVFRNDLTLARRQGPMTGSGTSKSFVRRVKPLYLHSEKEVIAYSKIMKFPVKYTRCPCSVDAYRKEYREMLTAFEKRHPPIKYNIVSFFLQSIYDMRKKHPQLFAEKSVVGECQYCAEPCAKDTCKRCQILITIKGEEKQEKKDKC